MVPGWPCVDHQPRVPQTAGSGRRAWRWTPLTARRLSTSFQGAGSGHCVRCSPRTVTGRWDSQSRAGNRSGRVGNLHTGGLARSCLAFSAAPAVPESAHHEWLEPAPWEPQDAWRPHVSVCDHSRGPASQHHGIHSRLLPEPVSPCVSPLWVRGHPLECPAQ